jgi:hypothetical protein
MANIIAPGLHGGIADGERVDAGYNADVPTELLPDSRPRVQRGTVFRGGVPWTPIYCANCGADGGLVPEENMTFAFYLCDPCFEKHGAIAGTMAVPDQVFWKKVHEAMLEKYGRILTPLELEKVVAAGESPLAKLIRAGR